VTVLAELFMGEIIVVFSIFLLVTRRWLMCLLESPVLWQNWQEHGERFLCLLGWLGSDGSTGSLPSLTVWTRA